MTHDEQRLLRHPRWSSCPSSSSARPWAYRVMRGKVTVAHIRANDHNAYW